MIFVDAILKYVLAGTTAAGLAWGAYEAWVVVPDLEHDRDKAVGDLKNFRSQHDKMVADNKAAIEKRERENAEFQAQTSKVIIDLLEKGRKDEALLAARARDVAAARVQLGDAQTRYLTAVANAATADPAASCSRYAAAANLLGQLHSETDRVAEEAAGAADAAAAQVIRLQAYVRDVCLRPLPGTVASQP